MDIVVRPPQTLQSFVACWQNLDIACPQHDLTKGVANPNTSHETKEVKSMVMVERLTPLCL
jgi:hypothetical protein